MTRSTVETAEAVEVCQMELPSTLSAAPVVFGFDGIVDTVREMVEELQSRDEYTRIDELGAVAAQIEASAAVDSSVVIEWVGKGTRTGGHVCHLSRALGGLGYEPRMLGTFDDPPRSVFEREFGEYRMVSIGSPGVTDAVEFNDGKLMITEPGSYRTLDWETLLDQVGLDRLAELVDGTALLGMGYWAMIPGLPDILDGLRTDLWPVLSSPPSDVLLDPSDVRPVSETQLRRGVESIAALDEVVPVTFSANRVESGVLARLFEPAVDDSDLAAAAATARAGLGVSRFAAHGVDEASMVTRDQSISVAVPRVTEPELTTSSGDHFNAGLAVALVEGLSDPAAPVLGNAVAGQFVRTGEAPSYETIRSFVEGYHDRLDG